MNEHIANEFRILGPPGTGKTTFLAKQIEREAEKHGPENVMVASYTKAAASVLNRRELPIPRENIGTLHALCYRGLKQYQIAEINAKTFNEEYPNDAISLTPASGMDEMAADAVYATEGDAHLNTYNLWRARCQELHTMPPRTIDWVKRWERWKYKENYIDFSDMITITLALKNPPPGEPTVGIYDEVQDFDKCQLNLIRHWAQFQDYIYLSGDDDQTIYSFSGASPDAFLSHPIAADHKRVLQQSWRLPQKIHTYSQQWIKQVKDREPKEFRPRDVEGSVSYLSATIRTPQAAIELAARYEQDGKTVMLIATCGFMLNTIKAQLREAGLTYHNPYRQTRGDWNPMGGFKKQQAGHISTRERILSFLNESSGGRGYWNAEDLVRWVDMLRIKGILKKGAKERIASLVDNQFGIISDEAEFYAQIFDEFALQRAMARDIAWFKDSLLSTKRSAVEYPLSVYQKRGRVALEEKPKIIIGTIHCSPPDEKVLTTKGYIQMDELNPDVHRVASYMFRCNRFTWNTSNNGKVNRGYEFEIAKNPYNGPLLTVTTDKSKTRITPDHRVRVKFADNFFNKWVVYLMRRGNWWRVGICTSGKLPYQSGGVLGRLATEKGDDGWILKVCETRKEALVHEEIIRGKYGITGLTFQSAINRSLDIEDLHRIHESINGSAMPRVTKLFADFGLAMDAPLYKRNAGPQRVRNTYAFEIPALNLISGYMLLPVIAENAPSGVPPKWLPLIVQKKHYSGDVYSLKVKPHEHYVSGGAVVHNSVKGGEADATIIFPDLSVAAMRDYEKNKDSTIRTFYVGMTRSRESLVICQPTSNMSVKLN